MSSFSLYGSDQGNEDEVNKVADVSDNEEDASGDEGGSAEEEDSGEDGDDQNCDEDDEDDDEEGDEDDADEGDDDNEEDEDREGSDEDEDELAAGVEEHMEEAGQTILTARKNFFEETAGFDYKGQFGEYHIRAYKHTGENDEMGYQWPVAFVAKDKHWISAAMWVKNDEGYELISIWAYNAKYEFSAQYYLEDFNNEDLAPFFDSNYRVYEHIITDDEAIQHFSCSDEAQAVEDFFCPALDLLSEQEVQELRANDPPAAGKRQKV